MTGDETGAGGDESAGRQESDGERDPGRERSDDPDYERQVRDAFPELESFSDPELREQVVEAWVLGLERGGWRDVHDIPYAWNIHEVDTVEHVRGTTRIALESARIQRDLHGAEPNLDVVRAACLLHDVGKCYEYVDSVDADADRGESSLVDPDPSYAGEEIPHSLSGYALAHEVGCPLAVQRAIPHVIGEVPERTLEAELVTSANAASSNAITQATMGISLDEWIARYSQTTK